MKCTNCGAECMGKFCSECGAKMPEEETVVAEPAMSKTDSINNLILRAEKVRADGDEEKALDYYERVLDLDPCHEEAQRAIDEIDGIIRHNNLFIRVDPAIVPTTAGSAFSSIVENVGIERKQKPFSIDVAVDNNSYVHIDSENAGAGMVTLGKHTIHMRDGKTTEAQSIEIKGIYDTLLITIRKVKGKLVSSFVRDANGEEVINSIGIKTLTGKKQSCVRSYGSKRTSYKPEQKAEIQKVLVQCTTPAVVQTPPVDKHCTCPHCGGRVSYQTVSEVKRRGFLWILLYILLICTGFGILILIPLLRGNKSVPKTYAVCQYCGRRWKV